ncbi:MAG: hypothetical protein PVJ01_04775 [Pseudomonadota bacterium]|jgi:hypothetical protein
MKLSIKDRSRTALEAILVLVLVVLFFLVILAMLNVFFPTGQSFLEMLRPGQNESGLSRRASNSRSLRLGSSNGEFGLDAGARFSAVLSRTERVVKSKRRDQIAWRDAQRGMTFYDSDALQTFNGSAATLDVKKDYSLSLGENSLVVLREMEQDLFTRAKRAVIVLVAGDLTGEVTQSADEDHDLEIVAPGAVARIPARADRSDPASFRMVVRPDNTSTLTVFEGNADLLFEGQTIAVGAHQTVRVQPGRRPVFLSPPPGPPVPVSPAYSEVFTYRDVPPRISFAWTPEKGVRKHHLILARDPGFEGIVYEETINGAGFVHGSLQPGDYYWKVRSENQDGKGEYSSPMRFELIQDLEPPSLEIDYPDSAQEGDRFVIAGKTDPGARVFVGGMPVKVDDTGRFTHGLFLQRGYNVIVVEAVDKLGNVNYFSKTVNVEF